MTRSSSGGGTRSPTDIDRAVGDNIRRLRLRRGQNLSDLAAQLGISHQQLQKYETGSNRLSAGMVCRAAEALGVPIESLFTLPDGARTQKQSARQAELEELRREGAYYLERASSRQALSQMVQVLRALSSGS